MVGGHYATRSRGYILIGRLLVTLCVSAFSAALRETPLLPCTLHPDGWVGGGWLSRPDRKDAGDELLEDGFVAVLGEFEHRRLGEGADGLFDSRETQIDVERTLPHVASDRARGFGVQASVNGSARVGCGGARATE